MMVFTTQINRFKPPSLHNGAIEKSKTELSVGMRHGRNVHIFKTIMSLCITQTNTETTPNTHHQSNKGSSASEQVGRFGEDNAT
jgi:hypothetical protein